jgi:hypothetical protein
MHGIAVCTAKPFEDNDFRNEYSLFKGLLSLSFNPIGLTTEAG